MTDDLVTVSTHPSMVEAELAKGVLEAAGIDAFIHAAHANALYPGILGEVMLQVKAEDLDEAMEILEEGEVVEE